MNTCSSFSAWFSQFKLKRYQPDATPTQFLSNQDINRLNLPFKQNFPSNQVQFINVIYRRYLTVPSLLKHQRARFFCFNFLFLIHRRYTYYWAITLLTFSDGLQHQTIHFTLPKHFKKQKETGWKEILSPKIICNILCLSFSGGRIQSVQQVLKRVQVTWKLQTTASLT